MPELAKEQFKELDELKQRCHEQGDVSACISYGTFDSLLSMAREAAQLREERLRTIPIGAFYPVLDKLKCEIERADQLEASLALVATERDHALKELAKDDAANMQGGEKLVPKDRLEAIAADDFCEFDECTTHAPVIGVCAACDAIYAARECLKLREEVNKPCPDCGYKPGERGHDETPAEADAVRGPRLRLIPPPSPVSNPEQLGENQ